MIVITFIALGLGIIGGLWLSKEAQTELKAGRKWFVAILVVCLIALGLGAFFLRSLHDYNAFLASCLFLATLAAVSYRKSL